MIYINRAAELFKMPEAESAFKDAGHPLGSLTGKVPMGYLQLYQKWWQQKQLVMAEVNDFLQFHSASFGITRSGKSNGTGRLIEEMLLKGIKCLVIDYYGEHKTIGDMPGFRMKVVKINGKGGEIAAEFVKSEGSLLINLENTKDTEYLPYLYDFMDGLWDARRAEKESCEQTGAYFTTIKLFVDEAHQYMPRQASKDMPKVLKSLARNLKGCFRNVAQQGLGLGISLHLVTQRPTYLDTFIRNQCAVFLLYQQGWENDIEVYLNLIPANGGGTKMRLIRENAIKNMAKGAVIFIRSGARLSEVKMLLKRSSDLRQTPGWEEYVAKQEAIRHGWHRKAVNSASEQEELS